MKTATIFRPRKVQLLFSAFIGVVPGYFRARRAARMDLIEALRHE
jgi:ABC-type antimicrobial peptide transport system permease subunit